MNEKLWSVHEVDAFINAFRPYRLLLKVANRCNINCSYCYWFLDDRVYERSKVLTVDAERLLYARLDEYFSDEKPTRFAINFHGGEPLLLGKRRFAELCSCLRQIADIYSVRLSLSVQTNGILVDHEWAGIFKDFRVIVGVSLDGDQRINDISRLDFRGGSTYRKVVGAIETLKSHNVSVGILAVWSPKSKAFDICRHFAYDLGVFDVDFLMPDGTLEQTIDCTGMAEFFCAVFDLWYFEEIDSRFDVRIARNILSLLLSGNSDSESLGLGPTTTFAIGTEGGYEVLDVLNVIGSGAALTRASLRDTPLAKVSQIPEWRKQVEASVTFPHQCVQCPIVQECGGGYLPSRYSTTNGFNNPSRNCTDILKIMAHARLTVRSDIDNLRRLHAQRVCID